MAEGPLQKLRYERAGLFHRIGRVLKSPGDILLIFCIGLFIWTLPRAMQKSGLPDFLERIRHARRPKAADLAAGVERIARLRQPWFRIPPLTSRNTCYTRAITLYRFLCVSEGNLKIHFGLEPSRTPGDHPHGHAWVTADGEILEPPDPVVAGLVRELYVYPPE